MSHLGPFSLAESDIALGPSLLPIIFHLRIRVAGSVDARVMKGRNIGLIDLRYRRGQGVADAGLPCAPKAQLFALERRANFPRGMTQPGIERAGTLSGIQVQVAVGDRLRIGHGLCGQRSAALRDASERDDRGGKNGSDGSRPIFDGTVALGGQKLRSQVAQSRGRQRSIRRGPDPNSALATRNFGIGRARARIVSCESGGQARCRPM
jgi:hypothetical protein